MDDRANLPLGAVVSHSETTMRDRWHGMTVCIAASGPSLTESDARYAWSHSQRLIVVNKSWLLAPRADVLYAADAGWWRQHSPTRSEFTGERWTSSRAWEGASKPDDFGCNVVITKPGIGVADNEPIWEGSNGAFQAMGLAVMWGARRIVFIGLDLAHSADGRAHWHEDYVGLANSPGVALAAFRDAFNKAAPILAARGVTVINASRQTAIDCFPRAELQSALSVHA